MPSSTPLDENPVSPKRKRVHGSLEKEHSRGIVTIRSQKPGLINSSPISRVDVSEATQGAMAALRKPTEKKVRGDIELSNGGDEAETKVLDPIVISKLKIGDVGAANFSPKLEILETPSPDSTALANSPAQHDSLSQMTSALWWEEEEITGHDPQDPTDDGYGINGIGFIPTPAVERARVELRKRQIAAWKIREAKEARQARSDRRRRDNGLESQTCILGGSTDDEPKQAKKVRFLEA